jgi:hypothetical protein
VRRTIVRRSNIIMLGERARGAEDLGQAVDDRVDVVAELADEVGVVVIVEVADEMSRGCGVLEELLEDGSIEGQLHDPIVGHLIPNVRHFCLALSGIRLR